MRLYALLTYLEASPHHKYRYYLFKSRGMLPHNGKLKGEFKTFKNWFLLCLDFIRDRKKKNNITLIDGSEKKMYITFRDIFVCYTWGSRGSLKAKVIGWKWAYLRCG